MKRDNVGASVLYPGYLPAFIQKIKMLFDVFFDGIIKRLIYIGL